jgi:hypothetical protein
LNKFGFDFADKNFKSESDPADGLAFALGFVLLPSLIKKGLLSFLGLDVIEKGTGILSGAVFSFFEEECTY